MDSFKHRRPTSGTPSSSSSSAGSSTNTTFLGTIEQRMSNMSLQQDSQVTNRSMETVVDPVVAILDSFTTDELFKFKKLLADPVVEITPLPIPFPQTIQTIDGRTDQLSTLGTPPSTRYTIKENVERLIQQKMANMSLQEVAQYTNPPPAPKSALKPIELKSLRYDCSDIDLRPVSKDDWNNTDYDTKGCLQLPQLSHRQLSTLGREFITEVKSKFSRQTVGKLMVLAYNILTPSGEPIFERPDQTIYSLADAISYDELRTEAIRSPKPGENIRFEIVEAADDKKLATAYTFIACAYLRLFSKPVQNFMSIEGQLIKRFHSLYGYPIPIRKFLPCEEAVSLIKAKIEFPVFEKTFYVILHCGLKNERCENIKSFLYDTHVSFTGLHPYVLFCEATRVMNVTPFELASAMYNKKVSSHLLAMGKVLSDLVGDENKTMWKYAKIFEHKFLRDLQTRNSKFFTLVLAFLLHIKEPTVHKNVLNIAQLGNVVEYERKSAKISAIRLIHKIECLYEKRNT